jgi:NSS family neurotransmitter:Na+ symporter
MSGKAVGKTIHGSWSSPWMFVLVSAGFVVGLKNIWQFPHHLALYGGSAFLFAYVVFLLLLGVPMLMTQIMLGRLGRASPVTGFAGIARRAHAASIWRWAGAASVLAGFLVYTYYAVVAGWILAYAARAAGGILNGLTFEGAASVFLALVKDPEKQLFWHSLFVLLTMLTVAGGVRDGLERVTRYTVPLIFLLLLLLVGYATGSGSFRLGSEYFLRTDFSQLGTDGLLVAMGDAFFSLGLGVGTFMMYGAYLPQTGPVFRLALYVVLADLVAGVLAGFAVFPVLFAGGGLSAAGPELVFQSLAVAFDPLPLGALMRTILFVLLILVAWMSTIGLAEPVVAWLVESRKITRARAAVWTGAAAWAIGVVCILSLNYLAFSFSFLGLTRTFGLFDILIILTSFVILPLVGLALALFAGWVLRPQATRDALAIESPCVHDVWLWLNRLGIPIMLVILLFGMRLFL